jgi:uncharacterized protein (TIGR03086 family)
MADDVDLLASVLDKTAEVIAGVPPDVGTRPTPCPDYDVAALVDHLVSWVERFAIAAEGRPDAAAAGGSSGEAAPADAFRAAGRRAVTAFRAGATERTVSVAGGELPGRAVVGMMLMEYIGHGWDLATATGQHVPYDGEEATAALRAGQGMLRPEYRGPDKAFAHEVAVPDDAGPVERLVGFLGRDPAWTTR